jgi:hypothetical protein
MPRHSEITLKPGETTMNALTKLIDEFAALHAEVQRFKPTLERYEHLRKLLAGEADNQAPGDEIKLVGGTGFAEFSKPTLVRSVPAEKVPTVYKLLGEATFLKVVRVTVGDVERLLTAPQQAEVFEASTGARRLKSAGRLETQPARMFTEAVAGLHH